MYLEKIEDLVQAQNQIENLLTNNDVNLDMSRIIYLIVDELCLNVFGYNNNFIKLKIEVFINNSEIKLQFVDNGVKFNPLNHSAEQILDLPAEKRPIGGLGLHIVHHFADNLEYKYYDDKNHLTFIKYL
jgi:anti-sigma regulatory factor (Ser/Thr protein kinase)